jgi:sterol 3beta-glucosyltransferase
MKIVILTSYGTRGDIQPYLALALRLKKEGHEVILAAGIEYASFIQERQVQYTPMHINVQEIFQLKQCRAFFYGKGKEKQEANIEWRKLLTIHIPKILDEIWVASQGADCLIYPPTLYPVWHIAEKLKIPAIISIAVPIVSVTAAFPAILLCANDLGKFLNRWSHRLQISMLMRSFREIVKQWCRNTLQVKSPGRFMNYLSRNGDPIPVLYPYSPMVLPMPGDWNNTTLASGYWFLERHEDWKPSVELESFLAKGPAPVFLGFGSMAARNPENTHHLILSALRIAGERGIICLGRSGMNANKKSDFVHYEEQIPYDWLFTRVKAVVHHGGSGTLGIGLRYGKPNIICPFIPEQTFWGNQVKRLNAGPSPIPQIPNEDFTAERLAEAIKTAVSDPMILRGAENLGKAIRNEDGLGNAVNFIHAQIEAYYRKESNTSNYYQRSINNNNPG